MAKWFTLHGTKAKVDRPVFDDLLKKVMKTLRVRYNHVSLFMFKSNADYLQESKSIVKRLVTADYIDQLIDDPLASANVCYAVSSVRGDVG